MEDDLSEGLFQGFAGTGGRRQLEILETGFNKTMIILKQPLANTQDPVKKNVYNQFTYVISLSTLLNVSFNYNQC